MYELAQSLVSWVGLALIVLVLIVILVLPKLKKKEENNNDNETVDVKVSKQTIEILFKNHLTKLDEIIKLISDWEKSSTNITQQINTVQLEIRNQHQTIQRLLDINMNSQKVISSSRLNSFERKSISKLDKIKDILGDTLNG